MTKIDLIKKIGFIGVGHFASFLVEGIRNKCPEMRIVLSPRNNEKSAYLSAKYNCYIAENNQQVSDESDIVIISVKPHDFADIVADINFRKQQTVISVAASLSINSISKLVAPAKAIRSLPISSAAINKSPTLMIPDDQDAKLFLELFGKVYVMDNEKQFTTAASYSAFYGWIFRIMNEAANWGEENGLEKENALEIIREVLSNVSEMSKKDAHIPLENIVESLATKGGITEQGLNIIEGKKGFDVWREALNSVHLRLSDMD